MSAETQLLERLDQVEAGMLGLDDTDLRMPISPSIRDPFDGNIWFISTQGLSMVTALTLAPQSAQFVVADGKSGLYATIEGTLTLVDNPKILDELWSPLKAAWLADPANNAPLRLLRLTPHAGVAWYSTTQGLRFLYDVSELEQPERLPTPKWAEKLTASTGG